jgi:hypothetical protein
MPQPPRLLDRVRHAIRVRHYSPRTETWIWDGNRSSCVTAREARIAW